MLFPDPQNVPSAHSGTSPSWMQLSSMKAQPAPSPKGEFWATS
jgi:hypothetical protein